MAKNNIISDTYTKDQRFEMPELHSWNNAHLSLGVCIDASGSISDAAWQNILTNLNRMCDEIRANKQAAETVEVCVSVFADTHRTIVPWTNVNNVPDMTTLVIPRGNLTDLDGCARSMAEEIREHDHAYFQRHIEVKRPFLVIMTDGMDTVTGNVDSASAYINQRERDGRLKTFFLGFGDYDRHAAAQLTAGSGGNVFQVSDGQYDFTDFFHLVALSTITASTKAVDEPVDVQTPINTAASNVKFGDPLGEFLNS